MNWGLGSPVEYWVILKESEKRYKYQDHASEQEKKIGSTIVTVIPIEICALRTITKGWRPAKRHHEKDQPKYWEESWDVMKLAGTQTLVKDHQQTLVGKNFQKIKVLLLLLYTLQIFRYRLSLIDSQYPQTSRTIGSIVVVFNNIVIWIVLIWYSISLSFRKISKPLWTVPLVLIIICITVIFMFHSFLSSLPRFKYVSVFSLSSFLLGSLQDLQNLQYGRFSFFDFIFYSGLMIGIRFSFYESKSSGNSCILFSMLNSGCFM